MRIITRAIEGKIGSSKEQKDSMTHAKTAEFLNIELEIIRPINKMLAKDWCGRRN